MLVFHGSSVEVQMPRIIRTQSGRDYGYAFYVTELREQAERWAVRKAKIARRNGLVDDTPVVSVYDFDENTARKTLKCLDFPEPSKEWLDLILVCRANKEYCHGYDVVNGKIADDNVGETVTFVQQRIMRKEDALERLKFQRINSQIALCSEKALTLLSFQYSYSPEEE